MPRSRQLSASFVLSCAAVLLAAASCGGGDDDADRPQPTTTTVAPTATTQSQEEDDEESLRQLAEDWYLVVRQVTYGEVEFEVAADYTSGEYLDALEVDVAEFRASGNRGERDERTMTVVEDVSVNGDRAVVVECLVDHDVLLGQGGQVLNDAVMATRFETDAERTSDGWRFVKRTQLGASAEGESCAAS